MSGRGKALLTVLAVLFLGVFLPFFISWGESVPGFWEQEEMGISAPDEGGDNGQILLDNGLKPQSAGRELTGRRPGGSQIRFSASLLIMMQIFTLLLQRKLCFAAYPVSQTPVARFLWDLFARQRKDGKKRGLIFSM